MWYNIDVTENQIFILRTALFGSERNGDMKGYKEYEEYAGGYATTIVRMVADKWKTLLDKITEKDSVKVSFYFNHEIKIRSIDFIEVAEKTIGEFLLLEEEARNKIIHEAENELREEIKPYGWEIIFEEDNIVMKKRQ